MVRRIMILALIGAMVLAGCAQQQQTPAPQGTAVQGTPYPSGTDVLGTTREPDATGTAAGGTAMPPAGTGTPEVAPTGQMTATAVVTNSDVVRNEGTVTEDRLEQGGTVTLALVAEGLTAPVAMAQPDDDTGRLFVVDQTGVIYVVDGDGNLLAEPFLDVRDRMVELRQDYDERGLLGLAFHPDYRNNGRFFVHYNRPLREGAPEGWDDTVTISEFQVSPDDVNTADPNSEKVLLQIDKPQYNHNGGTVAFGPDGFLYISIGDGGGANDTAEGHVPGGNAQDTSHLLGKILRIDVDNPGEGEKAYAIPADNPFASGENGSAPEIYAWGLRNPYRFAFDMGGSNALYVADAGQNLFEEVDLVQSPGNYGWNIKEGTHCFSPDNPSAPPEECPDTAQNGEQLIDPVIEYVNIKHPSGLGTVIVGGHVYRGQALGELDGAYIFGDWSTARPSPGGRLFMSMTPAGQAGTTGQLWPIQELVPHIEGQEGQEGFPYYVLGFGQDLSGEIYVFITPAEGPTGAGAVYRIAGFDPAACDTDAGPPMPSGTGTPGAVGTAPSGTTTAAPTP